MYREMEYIKYISQNCLVCRCGGRFKAVSLGGHIKTKKHLSYLEFLKNEAEN